MDAPPTVDFSRMARLVAAAARRHGWRAPSYRSPPRIVGAARTIRRRKGGAVVAVQVRGRPRPAVVADLIEGVVVANALDPNEAGRARTELWAAVDAAAERVVAGVPDAA